MAWFRWWHRFIRLNTKPMREETAQEWSTRLSLLYNFLAWNAFGLVAYNVYKGYNSEDKLATEQETSLSSGQQLAKKMGKDNAKVVRFKGFEMVKVDQSSHIEQGNSEELRE